MRFDGGHKRDRFLTDVLRRYVEFVPVCPEVEIGLGTPRETLRLVRAGGSLRMITTRTGIDHTERMQEWSERRLDELAAADLSGYVLKKDSPSCGMERVKTYGASDVPVRDGQGLFASALMARLPLLPVEEEGRLADDRLRDSFVERVFAYRRLQDFFAGDWTPAGLVRFHTLHKMSLLAHSTIAYEEIGRLVARAGKLPRGELRSAYERAFMGALRTPATRRRHANVLHHMAGHLKTKADAAARAEVASAIDDYRNGVTPLAAPITLLRHHVRVHRIGYLAEQVYLNPDRNELKLRSHV